MGILFDFFLYKIRRSNKQTKNVLSDIIELTKKKSTRQKIISYRLQDIHALKDARTKQISFRTKTCIVNGTFS